MLGFSKAHIQGYSPMSDRENNSCLTDDTVGFSQIIALIFCDPAFLVSKYDGGSRNFQATLCHHQPGF